MDTKEVQSADVEKLNAAVRSFIIYSGGFAMVGSHRIQIGNNRICFDFTVRRNITIIRGDSGTGKTTFLQLLRLYESRGAASGIQLECDKTCTMLGEVRWSENLKIISDSIVFIEEGNRFVFSKDFAEMVAKSDNYYVLVTREDISTLPYSVTEIYGFRVSEKYAGLKQIYNELYRLYPDHPTDSDSETKCIVTEDSNSGYQFFSGLCKNGMECFSAGGKSLIRSFVMRLSDRNPLVIADGAAFGPEIRRMEMLYQNGYKFQLYLPESFEWIILMSKLFNKGHVAEILNDPSSYIESSRYVSWERFFTTLLIQESEGSWLQYSKQKINSAYLHGTVPAAVAEVLPGKVRKCLDIKKKGEPYADNSLRPASK